MGHNWGLTTEMGTIEDRSNTQRWYMSTFFAGGLAVVAAIRRTRAVELRPRPSVHLRVLDTKGATMRPMTEFISFVVCLFELTDRCARRPLWLHAQRVRSRVIATALSRHYNL